MVASKLYVSGFIAVFYKLLSCLSKLFYLPFSQQYRCATAFYFMRLLSYKHKIVISRLICAPGHGKSIVDGLNASSKTELTLESANQLKAVDEASDDSVRKFAAHSMVDGTGFSAASKCKRMLQLDGTEGAKSIVKSEKGEKNRKVRSLLG